MSEATERDQAPYHRARRRHAKKQQACIWCLEDAAPGRTRCEACIAGARERYRQCREEGLCVRSCEPADGWACERCKKLDRERRRR